jgi:hypothetical protein
MAVDMKVELYAANINSFSKTFIILILLNSFHCLKYIWVIERLEIWLHSSVHVIVVTAQTVGPTSEMSCLLNSGLLQTVDNDQGSWR